MAYRQVARLGDYSGSGFRQNLIPALSTAHKKLLNSNTDAARRTTALKQKTTVPKSTTASSPTKSPSGTSAVPLHPTDASGTTYTRSSGSTYKSSSTPSSTPSISTSTSKAISSNAKQVDNWVDKMLKTTKQSSTFSTKEVDKAVEKLRKELYKSPTSPKLPEMINIDDYRTQLATIDDLTKKYGFDFSREYAERQAEILAQAQRNQIEAARARQEYLTESAQQDLEHDFFQEYLAQRQATVDSGLNAGIAAERDLRLEMSRQYALADILANQQLYEQELDAELQRIAAEEQTYAEKLYQERLQQAFGNVMDMSRFTQSENQFMARMAMEQRAQLAEEAWREFEFNNMSEAEKQRLLQNERHFGTEMAWRQYEFENMSAAEKAKLAADAERFGMEMAWQRHKFEAGLEFEAGLYGGFNSGSGSAGAATGAVASGTWRTSKGEPPASFKQHLTAALKATGYPTSWIQPMSELIARESSWNPKAKNPTSTAHGYGQFLNSTRRDYERKYGIQYSTPVNQLILTLHYVRDRYGDPFKAIQFHNRNNWY